MSNIILHCCCGPCATSSVERLINEGEKPTLFFSNSNIDTLEEFEKRLSQIEIVAKFFNTPLFVDPYQHKLWLDTIAGLEKSPEGGGRCQLCFKYNLNRTHMFLQNRTESSFTTTLTVSPHKHSETIFNIGNSFEDFTPFNFKKKGGFQRSIEISKDLKLYRQQYCGCEFSKVEREEKS